MEKNIHKQYTMSHKEIELWLEENGYENSGLRTNEYHQIDLYLSDVLFYFTQSQLSFFKVNNFFMSYIDLVRELNIELYERFGEVEKGFEYSTTGFVDAISFDGVLLWDSETDCREWIEEENDYEPFEPFIKRIFNEYLDKTHSLKL